MIEIWKDVKGFDGFYQVSNLGRVKSVSRKIGNCFRKEKIRSLSLTKDGYVKLRLSYCGKDVTKRVHRLVAEAFIPNPENKETVNHKDGNKLNNCIYNLEWADRSEQMYHAYKHSLKKSERGTENAQSKLTVEQIKEIRKTYVRYSRKYGTIALADKYGVTNRVIGLIVKNLSYKNVV